MSGVTFTQPEGEESGSPTIRGPATPRDPNEVTLHDIYNLIQSLQTEIRDLRTQVDRTRSLQTGANEMLEKIDGSTEPIKKETPVVSSLAGTSGLFGLGSESKGKGRETTPEADAPATANPPKKGKAKFKIPDAYDGKNKGKEAKQWLSKMLIYMMANNDEWDSDNLRMLWFLANMSGIAADWAQVKMTAIFEHPQNLLRQEPSVRSIDSLTEAFAHDFNDLDAKRNAHRRITALKMTEVGKIQEYTLEFQTIMADLGWNDEALIGQYRLNLHY